MEDMPERNHDLPVPDLFTFFNHYFLLFFSLSCILSSLFLQELLIMLGQFRLAISVAPGIGILLPIFFLARRFHPGFRKQFRIKAPNPRITIYVSLATLGMVVIVAHLYVISQIFLPPPEAYVESLVRYRPTSVFAAIITFAGLCVVVPVAEEIVFRGMIQEIFNRNMSGLLTVLLAGTFFGVMHLNPQLLAGLVCFGIFLGIIFRVTSNLSYSILAHSVLNTVAFLQLALLSEESMATAPFYVREWWMLPAAVLIVVILLRETRKGVSISLETPRETPDRPESR